MSFIQVDRISYTYPIPEEYPEEFTEEQAEQKQGNAADAAADRSAVSLSEAVPALQDVSLSIEEGQFVCILGRNGSGKSTLARHFNALIAPDEGTVWIDGKDTRNEAAVWDIRANVGMVFQNPDNQIIGSVVEEDVAFGLENLGVPSPEIQDRVRQALENVNMSAYAQHSPNALSGGQKQRVAVAGILAMQPKCIVLDEATAMLDPKGREEVMKTAIRLNKEKRITLIAITHYMDETLQADKIFVMKQGRVLMDGVPREIFSKKKEIESLGLKLPPACELAGKLRESGLPVPNDVIRKEELVEWLKAYKLQLFVKNG